MSNNNNTPSYNNKIAKIYNELISGDKTYS